MNFLHGIQFWWFWCLLLSSFLKKNSGSWFFSCGVLFLLTNFPIWEFIGLHGKFKILKKKKKLFQLYSNFVGVLLLFFLLWGFFWVLCWVFFCLFFPCCKACLLLPCCKTISFFQYPPTCLAFELLLSVAVSPAGVSSRVLVQPLSHREMLSEFTLSISLLAALC